MTVNHDTLRQVALAGMKRARHGAQRYATITVYRGPAGAEEPMEVDLEGVPVPPDRFAGLSTWDIEGLRATYQGADFTLTQQETERAVALLLGN